MKHYIAFLRAVNVGGTGKLPMSELRNMCVALGFTDVSTYIASGNVAFTSCEGKRHVKTALERQLRGYAGKDIGVIVRTPTELAAMLTSNPFTDRDPRRSVVIFLDSKPPADALASLSGQDAEELALGAQEIYVYYANGMGRSKLRIPAARTGTARNLNTIRKMLERAAG